MTANKENIEIDWIDPDEIPDLASPEWEAAISAAPVRRGRPKLDRPKVSTTIRLDHDVLDALRASGKGWQGRANMALRRALGL